MSLLKSVANLTEALADVPSKAIQGLAQAKGIVFFKLTKMGCIVTVRGGNGCVLLRNADGKFSAPLAISFGGFALGADIGLEQSEFLMFFKSHESTIAFMEGNATVGLNAGLSLGPVGIEAEVLSNSGTKETITVVARSVGLYGGVSLEFSGVKPNNRANMTQYERRIEVNDLADGNVEIPKEFEKLYQVLYKEQEHAQARLDEVNAKAAALEREAKEAAAKAAQEEAAKKAEEARKILEEVTIAKAEEETLLSKALAARAYAARLEADAQKAAAERARQAAEAKAQRAANAANEAEAALETGKKQEETAAEASKAAKVQEAKDLKEAAEKAKAEAEALAKKAEAADAAAKYEHLKAVESMPPPAPEADLEAEDSTADVAAV